MRERNDEFFCTVPLFCLSPLSLQLVVCLCSVVHRTVYTLTRSCLSARTIHDLVAWLKIPMLRRPHKIRSSPCHPCLHLHMSVPHSHLLLRSLHQKQPLRSSCRPVNTALLRQIEESGPLAKTTSSTAYEPDVIDNFDYSVTSETFLQELSSDTMPSYLHDAELSDETIGKALSSPLFIQERRSKCEPVAGFHSQRESLFQRAQSIFSKYGETRRLDVTKSANLTKS